MLTFCERTRMLDETHPKRKASVRLRVSAPACSGRWFERSQDSILKESIRAQKRTCPRAIGPGPPRGRPRGAPLTAYPTPPRNLTAAVGPANFCLDHRINAARPLLSWAGRSVPLCSGFLPVGAAPRRARASSRTGCDFGPRTGRAPRGQELGRARAKLRARRPGIPGSRSTGRVRKGEAGTLVQGRPGVS